MGQHVFFVDSEDLGEVERLYFSFLKSFAADSSVCNLLIVFVVYSHNLQKILLSHFFWFHLSDELRPKILQFL